MGGRGNNVVVAKAVMAEAVVGPGGDAQWEARAGGWLGRAGSTCDRRENRRRGRRRERVERGGRDGQEGGDGGVGGG